MLFTGTYLVVYLLTQLYKLDVPPAHLQPFALVIKASPHCRRKVRLYCRRKVRLSQKSTTVAEFRRCLAVFGDSRSFLRQCGQGLSRLNMLSYMTYMTVVS